MTQVQVSDKKSLKLIMEGSAALSDVEEHGMRIDVGYLDKVIEWSGKEIKRLQSELRDDEVYRLMRKRFGDRAKVDNRNQLASVLTEDMEVEWSDKTKTGKPKVDEDALQKVNHPFIKKWLSLEKLKKARSTYLIGMRRETVDGFLHPFFHLHLAKTYRSSCTEPNLQNQPIRDKKQAKLIRRAFIPREGHVLVEVDYSALEFKGAACFWTDSGMVEYASDDDLDIHRDMAVDIFLCSRESVSKEMRFHAKNGFVFATLYGSYYVNCARHIWDVMQKESIFLSDGTPVLDHLRSEGITELGDKHGGSGTFIGHMEKVERKFNNRFETWSDKKEEWWSDYLKRGWFPLLTGFVCKGIYSRNQLMNTPIQGPSFHCELWSTIELNKELKQRKMRSVIVCQIHDSILIDAHESELQEVLDLAVDIMTHRIREHWSWIIVPLSVEAEVGEKNWFEKKEWVQKEGQWQAA